MTTLNDIKLAVIRELREGTDIRNIYGEEIHRKEFPLFQVNLVPGSFSTAAAGQHTDKSILVDVLFMEEDFTSYEKNYEMLEAIDRVLRPVLAVGNRKLTVRDATMDITDHVAHYKFYLEFTDVGNVPGEEGIPVMEELGLRI